MTDLELLLARLDALEARLSILEAERASRWHHQANPDAYQPHRAQPVYEYYMEPTMRETRNGNGS